MQNKNDNFWPSFILVVENNNEKFLKSLFLSAIRYSSVYKQYYFKKDSHWNEEGNKIAAIALMRQYG